MRRRWRRKHLAQAPEINITAFMNLMVILVPFLLLTAVFSRITILELDVPKSSNTSMPLKEEQPLILEVTVRKQLIEVGDQKRGLLKRINVTTDGGDLKSLSELLQQIKARHQDKTDITLLLEKDIPYARLVEVMDTLRVVRVEQNNEMVNAELFPAISIGDAESLDLLSDNGSQL